MRHNPFYADVLVDADALASLPADGPLPGVGVRAAAADVGLAVGPADAQQEGPTVAGMPLNAAVLDTEGEGLLPRDLWQEALSPGSEPEHPVVVLPHGATPLSTFDVAYWTWCFPLLYCTADSVFFESMVQAPAPASRPARL